MDLVVGWVAFPAVLFLICLGCGLLVERTAGRTLPGVLLLPLGLAAVVVATQIATNWDRTAELATPLVMVLALAGLVAGRARIRSFKLDRWALAAAVGVAAVFAAPIVLSGHATLAGYNLNGEPSIHMIGIDRLMHHGRSIAGLEPSSYQFCLKIFFGVGYPSGAQTALGAVQPLSGKDVFSIYQPFLVFLVTMSALALYSIVTPLIERRYVRVLVVFIAAQPALVYAYSLQGSLKELSLLFALTLLFALVPLFIAERGRGVRLVVPLAVATAAGLGVINIAILPWLGLLLPACLVLTLRARGRAEWKAIAKQALVFCLIVGVLAYPALSVAPDLYATANDQLTAQSDLSAARGLGNLVGPLNNLQVVGVWLNGDYRYPVVGRLHDVNYLLIGIALVAGAIGLIWAIRRRAGGVLVYGIVSAITCVYIVSRGSPWADGKALMITAPAVLLVVMLGPAALLKRDSPRWVRVFGLALAGVVAVGVIWSNALAYHEVNLAPAKRIAALEQVGKRISGQGPAIYFEYEEYGKHFLRNAAPDGRTEACQGRFRPQRGGAYPTQGFTADPDEETLRYLLQNRTIVLRRSPAISRPPSIYRLTFANQYYEVWQRPVGPVNEIVAHLPLRDQLSASGRPPCSEIDRLSAQARSVGGRLAFVRRPRPVAFVPARHPHPGNWPVDPSQHEILITDGPGKVGGTVAVPAADAYTLWVGGSFGRQMAISIDGKPVGDVSYQLNGRNQFMRIANVRLGKGRHVIVVTRGHGDLRPGNGGAIRSLGPVLLEPPLGQRRKVSYVSPGDARILCKLDLDWVEVVRH